MLLHLPTLVLLVGILMWTDMADMRKVRYNETKCKKKIQRKVIILVWKQKK